MNDGKRRRWGTPEQVDRPQWRAAWERRRGPVRTRCAGGADALHCCKRSLAHGRGSVGVRKVDRERRKRRKQRERRRKRLGRKGGQRDTEHGTKTERGAQARGGGLARTRRAREKDALLCFKSTCSTRVQKPQPHVAGQYFFVYFISPS